MNPMFSGFKKFLLRGNVVDLAVAVVIGAAFTRVVNSLVDSFLTPLIALVSGGGTLGGRRRSSGQDFTWGAFLSSVIGFLRTAAVVYFLVVLPVHRLLDRVVRGKEPGPVGRPRWSCWSRSGTSSDLSRAAPPRGLPPAATAQHSARPPAAGASQSLPQCGGRSSR